MRMAAYCRVSTEKEEQLSSLENQRNTEQYADDGEIYAGKGISGKSMSKRIYSHGRFQNAAFDYVAVKRRQPIARNIC